MTRKEEIIQAAQQAEKEVGFTQIVKDAKGVNSAYGIGFLEGAEWADNHPNLIWKDIVKNVNLEEELKRLIGNVGQCDRKLAKHFFELGLKAQKGK